MLALLLVVGVITAVTRGGGPSNPDHDATAMRGNGDAGAAALSALRYRPGSDDEFSERAANGFSQALFSQVPGGAVQTAKRVAQWRSQIEAATDVDESPLDADTLEALVYLESAGRPNAAASGKAADAVGLTQIVAETGTSLLDLRINVKRSDAFTAALAKLTGRIARWNARGSAAAAARGTRQLRTLRIKRAQVDPRFVPKQALAATVRYLQFAKGRLGREDLALTSYHMGVGNLERVMTAYGRKSISYAQLYFDVDPQRSPKAYGILSQLQDDSATYYWRILAAKAIMKAYRDDPAALASRAALITSKASRENLLHPPTDNPSFKDPAALATALKDGTLIELPIGALNANGVAVSPAMGQLAGRLKAPKSSYRALRRGPLAALVTIGAAVHELTGGKVLTATSAVRDEQYQALLQAENIEATRAYSIHTSGWAVDMSRTYASNRQAQMFQFVLTRMQALDLITWVREPTAIHWTSSPDSESRLGPVLEVALGRS